MIDRKLRVGVIGCSTIAENSVLPAINSSKNIELNSIGSRNDEKSKKFADKFGSKKFGSYEQVIEDNDIDLVYISLPIGLQEEWVIRAARSGKHILCEKSSTTSFSSANKMVRVCKENQVRLMEGLMFRFHPQHEKVLEIIKNKKLGDVKYFHGEYGFPMPSENNIRMKPELGGGVLNDACCYPICATRIVFDKEPDSVSAKLYIDKLSQVDTRCQVSLYFDDGKISTMNVGYGMFFRSIYEIWGTQGHLELNRAYNVPINFEPTILLKTENTEQPTTIEAANHFEIMLDALSNEIRNPGVGKYDLENDLLNQARVLEACRKSHNEQRIVKIDEIT